MIIQILNQMYELHENIKTSEDLIDFLQKAKPLYLKGLELCDALDKLSLELPLGECEIIVEKPLEGGDLWCILDQQLDVGSGLCGLFYNTFAHVGLSHWKEILKEAMLPHKKLFYKGNMGIRFSSDVSEVRNSFNLRIELIDKMLVIAKSKYNEH